MRRALTDGPAPVLEIALETGEALFARGATMLWMGEGIEMATNGRRGVLGGGFRSPPTGELFVVDWVARHAASLAFAARLPGAIVPMTLGAGETLLFRPELLICATRPMHSEIAFDEAPLVLARLVGPGTAFLSFAGGRIEREIAAGERLRVPVAHVGIVTAGIVVSVGRAPGFRNTLSGAGGGGLHLATLTGPGRVTLQAMAMPNLANDVGALLPDVRSD